MTISNTAKETMKKIAQAMITSRMVNALVRSDVPAPKEPPELAADGFKAMIISVL